MNSPSVRKSLATQLDVVRVMKKRCFPSHRHLPLLSSPSAKLPQHRLLTTSTASIDPPRNGHVSSHGRKEPMVQITKTKTTSSSTTATAYSQESAQATKLVDDLLTYTRSLMDNGDSSVANHNKHHIIAYSGGIDSSVVAALVYHSATGQETVRAVLGESPAVPAEQIQLAEQVAQHIGVALEKIPTTEGTDAVYIENAGQACLACKTHLYTCLESIVQHTSSQSTSSSDPQQHQQPSPSLLQLYNGTNADDLLDPTRLGLIAAERHNVQSPLQFTTKEQVRLAGRHLGLPNWNYAASPCLRSRLAIGVQAIPQHLQRIEQAERHVRDSLRLDATHNLRVRLLSKNRAMIEVETGILEEAESWLDEWQPYFCDELEFASVSVRPFKSGSVAPKEEDSAAAMEELQQAVAG